MKPTAPVGRMVHYVAFGTPGGEYEAGAHRAAVITEVVATNTEVVGLCVLNPTGLFFRHDVPFDEHARTPGTWHWPEYVP